MDIKDEIRARLPIDQLVGQYCQLKKKGRNFVCLCPFHSDKNPSFLVSPDKGIAYCFACQSGGDVFSFYQKIESVDFPTAVRALAEKAGVRIPKEHVGKQTSVTKDEKERLRECLLAAQVFYEKTLQEVPVAKDYVASRGVPQEIMQRFGIGYAPDSFSATYDHLLKAGFSRSEIVAAGLGVQKDIDGKIYDRFRHRIMFPIHDGQGVVIGFGGRAMGDSDAKYVNSPEGILYHKSSVLFGLFQARDAIRKSRRVVLVEGYFDCTAAHKAGTENVVAVSGTALTEEHVRILKRYADEVVLCLDQDSAGQLAAGRAFDLLSREHLKISSVTLPAKDPDELVQRDAALFAQIIETGAVPYVDAVIEKLATRPDVREPRGKVAIAETLFPLLAALPLSTELRAYIEKAAGRFGFVEGDMLSDFQEWKSTHVRGKPAVKKTDMQESPYSSLELCIGVALLHPHLRPIVSELILGENHPLHPVRAALQTAGDAAVTDILMPLVAEQVEKERLQVLTLYCEESFPTWSESMAAKEFRKLMGSANRENMMKKQVDIVRELKEARAKGRPDEEARLLTKYQQLLKLTKMASPT